MLLKRLLLGIPALAAASCIGGSLPPSVWPPANFRLVVDELKARDDGLRVVRRLHVDASGVVVYGTSARPLVDPETGASLPVFDRLSVYRLEPKSVRALARKLDRYGIGDLVVPMPASGLGEGPGLVLTWQAFAQRRVLTSTGRLRGRIGEIMALVAAHLPPGEQFESEMSRSVVPVLRGAPEPVVDVAGALTALREQLEQRPEDTVLLLEAFALACRADDRALAVELLERWLQVAEAEFGTSGFATDPDAAPRRRAEAMRRMLPAG
ncbi:MAG: hypothetical protein KAI24_24585 [Planctomycetes bacterium]|nr:hypothetical protein [Planctomycetota bacterium]